MTPGNATDGRKGPDPTEGPPLPHPSPPPFGSTTNNTNRFAPLFENDTEFADVTDFTVDPNTSPNNDGTNTHPHTTTIGLSTLTDSTAPSTKANYNGLSTLPESTAPTSIFSPQELSTLNDSNAPSTNANSNEQSTPPEHTTTFSPRGLSTLTDSTAPNNEANTEANTKELSNPTDSTTPTSTFSPQGLSTLNDNTAPSTNVNHQEWNKLSTNPTNDQHTNNSHFTMLVNTMTQHHNQAYQPPTTNPYSSHNPTTAFGHNPTSHLNQQAFPPLQNTLPQEQPPNATYASVANNEHNHSDTKTHNTMTTTESGWTTVPITVKKKHQPITTNKIMATTVWAEYEAERLDIQLANQLEQRRAAEQ